MSELWCQNRLFIVGPAGELRSFNRHVNWKDSPGMAHVELLEQSPGRHAWQFETDHPTLLLQWLKRLSCGWPCLVFLLDYDQEDQKIKGLVKAKGGKLRHYRFSY